MRGGVACGGVETCASGGVLALGLAALVCGMACEVGNPAFDGVASPNEADAAAPPADAGDVGAAGGGGGNVSGTGGAGAGGAGGAAMTGGQGGLIGSAGAGGAGGAFVASSYCPQTDPALRLCLAFDGTPEDLSPGRHAPAASGLLFAASPAGQALALDGNGQLSFAESTDFTLTQMTVELWVRPLRLPAPGARMVIVDNDLEYGLALLDDGHLACEVAGIRTISLDPLTVDAWQHVACVWSTTGMALFINGAPSGGSGQRITGNDSGSSGIFVGGKAPSFAEPFVGRLDNLRLWARALDSQDMALLP